MKTLLDDISINLTPEERQTLPKIADKTLDFDDKCETYMGTHPGLVPGFIEMDESTIPPHSPTPIPVLTVSGAAGAKGNS